MEIPPFEDVSPIQNDDFPCHVSFREGNIPQEKHNAKV